MGYAQYRLAQSRARRRSGAAAGEGALPIVIVRQNRRSTHAACPNRRAAAPALRVGGSIAGSQEESRPDARPRQSVLVKRYRERRQRNWERSVRWTRRHPRIGTICLWWLTVMIVLEAAFATANAIQGWWLAAAYYSLGAALFVWLRWTWAHVMRGTPRPPMIRVHRA